MKLLTSLSMSRTVVVLGTEVELGGSVGGETSSEKVGEPRVAALEVVVCNLNLLESGFALAGGISLATIELETE